MSNQRLSFSDYPKPLFFMTKLLSVVALATLGINMAASNRALKSLKQNPAGRQLLQEANTRPDLKVGVVRALTCIFNINCKYCYVHRNNKTIVYSNIQNFND